MYASHFERQLNELKIQTHRYVLYAYNGNQAIDCHYEPDKYNALTLHACTPNADFSMGDIVAMCRTFLFVCEIGFTWDTFILVRIFGVWWIL